MARTQHGFDLVGRAVPKPYPYHFGRRTSHEAALAEVVVLGDDREPSICRVPPDGLVVGGLQIELTDVNGPRIEFSEPPHEARREVVVEEEFQGLPRGRLGGRVGDQAALAVGRERQGGADIVALEVGEVGEDLLLTHPASEVVQHVVHGNAEAADAGLAAPLPGLDGDALAVVHAFESRPLGGLGQERQPVLMDAPCGWLTRIGHFRHNQAIPARTVQTGTFMPPNPGIGSELPHPPLT